MKQNSVTFEQAKKLFPDEWILFGNPEMKNTDVKSGVIVYHSKDKKEVCYIGKDKTAEFETVTIAFTGNIKQHRRIGILKRV
ncbi:MAG: hypothetical protein D4R43_02285 [Sphingobacteriales bacterium]|nr:MAG: hypothetical protein D4R43_02285 [Sphingobacteriales bacterium]